MDKAEISIANRKGVISDISQAETESERAVAFCVTVNDIHGDFMSSIIFTFSESVLTSWGADLGNDGLNNQKEQLKNLIKAMSYNVDYRPGYEAPLPASAVNFIITSNPDEIGNREFDDFQSQHTFKVSAAFHTSARKLIYGKNYTPEKARILILKYLNVQKKLNDKIIVEYVEIEHEMFLTGTALDEVLSQLENMGAIMPTRAWGSIRPVYVEIQPHGSRLADELTTESGGNVNNIGNQYNINNYLNGNDNAVYNNISQQTVNMYDRLKEIIESIDDPEIRTKVGEELKASEEELNKGNKDTAIARLGNILALGAKAAPLVTELTKLIGMIHQ